MTIPFTAEDLSYSVDRSTAVRKRPPAPPAPDEPPWPGDVSRVETPPRPQAPRVAVAAPRILSWSDLMAEPPEPPPQVRPGIPAVGVTVNAGPPKIGKTLWTSQQALETGRPCLLVIEEGSLAGIAYRLRRQAEALGVTEPPLHVLYRQRIRLDDPRDVRRIRQHVSELKPALVVMDPLNRLHGADENKPTQMTPVMDALAAIAYEHGTAVVAVHHLSKPSAERRGSVWDRFRGASAIRSGTDANLAMDGSGDRIKLVGEFRDAEPLTMHLELDREALIFRETDAPTAPSKVDPIELRAYVEDRRQVTAREVCERFTVARHTALAALRGLGCDEYEGARRTLTFTLGASVQ